VNVKCAELDREADVAQPSEGDVLHIAAEDIVEGALQDAPLGVNPEEYELLYRPTMVGVYTARHQRMPNSEKALREHVFGCGGRPGCGECREETEFLVAHQKRFF
jgi:hypothetical protein